MENFLKIMDRLLYNYQNNNLRLILLFTSIILLPIRNCFSQNQLTGKVYSAKDSTAIFGASVYFDGTSIGVSTNDNGYFEISFRENNSTLIISSIGYEPIMIDPSKYPKNDDIPSFYLKEKLEELGAVYLEIDPWTRLRKLGVFKREFLGSNKSALNCKIINEDEIELRYIPSEKILVASSKEPLLIKNKYFGYLVQYNLTDFEVKFQLNENGLIMPYSTYYEGFSFFQRLRKKTSKQALKNRKQSYLGSSLHFFRSLYSKRLDENNFKIFYESFQVPTYKHLKITDQENLKEVEILVEEIAILYNDTEQSGLITNGTFLIDYLGNHSPPQSIILKGVMSKKRVSELLPLDFQLGF